MPFSIKIKENNNYNDHWLFEKNFNNLEELQTVSNYCSSKRSIGFFESTLITVRTDNYTNFCKDFFLPTFFNHAMKINDAALKIFMIPVCLAVDISTLLFRLITIIPRYYLNTTRQEHPLHQYLTSVGADARLLNTNHVCISIESEENRYEVTREQTVNFIDLPENESPFIHGYSSRGLS